MYRFEKDFKGQNFIQPYCKKKKKERQKSKDEERGYVLLQCFLLRHRKAFLFITSKMWQFSPFHKCKIYAQLENKFVADLTKYGLTLYINKDERHKILVHAWRLCLKFIWNSTQIWKKFCQKSPLPKFNKL